METYLLFPQMEPFLPPEQLPMQLLLRPSYFIKDWFDTMGTRARSHNWCSYKFRMELLCNDFARSAHGLRNSRECYQSLTTQRRELITILWEVFSHLQKREAKDRDVTKEFVNFTRVPHQIIYYSPLPPPLLALELEEDVFDGKQENGQDTASTPTILPPDVLLYLPPKAILHVPRAPM